MSEHGLGRRAALDLRDARFPLRALLAPAVPRRPRRLWPLFHAPLDQGRTGTCVGHGWEHWMMAAPTVKKDPLLPPNAYDLYRGACTLDEWADNDDGDLNWGSSVRGGAKWLQAEGRISAYHWAANADEVADYVAAAAGASGPVVIGVNWYSGMFEPDAGGVVRISGGIAGGHCVCVLGWDEPRGRFSLINSWGAGWGRKGRFYLDGETLERLLREDGEAAAATEVRPR